MVLLKDIPVDGDKALGLGIAAADTDAVRPELALSRGTARIVPDRVPFHLTAAEVNSRDEGVQVFERHLTRDRQAAKGPVVCHEQEAPATRAKRLAFKLE